MGVPISNVTRRVVYAASGTGPYNFTFEILAAGDIAVYRDDTLLTLTTNYTVTINSNGTGFVTLTATPTGATQIAIVGNRTISRTTDFVTGGDFFANTLNDELDQQTIFNQQNAEGLQRALIAPQTDPTTIDMTLPRAVDRANKTLAFDANGDPTLGISAADVANAVTYATNAANSATAAASSASAASSSASSASSSASTATTQASNASTSATNAANSASAASTSATNAASSASTAATQASNASTSATNAASSASAASTSASNAATSATNASNSASAAATSASNAATSETNAANSASAAAASAASAANTFDSFDDRYLGTKASNPTLDNDGNALVAGALYFSTSENIMKVYDGASWIAATSAGNVSFLRFRYVATSGQTTFSGSDSNSATLTYTVNNVVVFLNGVSLDQTEYTATSGTSVVLGAGAALNDELVIVAFKSFVTADMVPASTGGTYAGAVRFVAGSASVPSISVSGDTNTGIFFPAADTVAIGTGGTEALRVNSSQSLLLNTTSAPAASAKMKIATSARTGAFFDLTATGGENWIIDSTNTTGSTDVLGIYANGATGLYLQDNGNVGFGTSSPLGTLEIIRNTASATSTAYPSLRLDNQNASGYTGIYLLQSAVLKAWFEVSNSLGALQIGVGGTERARITSGGDFLFGKTATDVTNPGAFFESSSLNYGRLNFVKGTASGTGATAACAFYYNNSAVGSITNTSTATAYNTSSDYRLKENVQPMTGALAKVAALKPVTYTWKLDGSASEGFIAHELAEVCPQAVTGEKDSVETYTDEDGNEQTRPAYQGIDTSFLVATLTAAIQELKAIVDAQAVEIAALKGTA